MEWTIEETQSGLKLSPLTLRKLGSKKFTWAHLMYGKLGTVKVYVTYFPSRFNLDLDAVVMDNLRTFGKNTGPGTSVNFWDPTDPEFSKALTFFNLKYPPALTFTTGLQINGIKPYGPDKTNMYTIVITDQDVLRDNKRLTTATNSIHEVLVRGDPEEITSFLHKQSVNSLLTVIAKIAVSIRNEFLKFKPKFLLPDGTSIQVGE